MSRWQEKDEKHMLTRLQNGTTGFPVAGSAIELISKLQLHRYLLVVAETGAGKTIVIPPLLALIYHKIVIVAEPLIETVKGSAEYVAKILGQSVGEYVGYMTAEDQCVSASTRVIYVTDGLAWQWALHGKFNDEIWIVDERHQRSVNQDCLEAALWDAMTRSLPIFRILVLSATVDPKKILQGRTGAGYLKVPGRSYPINDEDRTGQDPIEGVIECVRNGRDVLFFLPTVKRIRDAMSKVRKRLIEEELVAELIPFYSELSRNEKDRAYARYRIPKVIFTTNALETGKTMENTDGLVVIDSGVALVSDWSGGVFVLEEKPISNQQRLQRRGRTGRTSPGSCWWYGAIPKHELPIEPEPEVLRMPVAKLVLDLEVAGKSIDAFPLLQKPNRVAIADAMKELEALGHQRNGKVTPRGKLAAQITAEPIEAELILSSIQHGCVEDMVKLIAMRSAKCRINEGAIGRSDPVAMLAQEMTPKASAQYERLKESLARLFPNIVWTSNPGNVPFVIVSVLGRMKSNTFSLRVKTKTSKNTHSSKGRQGNDLADDRFYVNDDPKIKWKLDKQSVVKSFPRNVYGLPIILSLTSKDDPSQRHEIHLVTWVTPEIGWVSRFWFAISPKVSLEKLAQKPTEVDSRASQKRGKDRAKTSPKRRWNDNSVPRRSSRFPEASVPPRRN